MQSRMNNPAMIVPDAMTAALALGKSIATSAKKSGLPSRTLHLVHLRASQINGCGFCVDMHSHEARKDGETDERLFGVAAWRESPYFNDAERAALALAEAASRLSDKPDAVPDEIWNEAVKHYDEAALATLILGIAAVNFWNRVNVPIRQVAGSWKP